MTVPTSISRQAALDGSEKEKRHPKRSWSMPVTAGSPRGLSTFTPIWACIPPPGSRRIVMAMKRRRLVTARGVGRAQRLATGSGVSTRTGRRSYRNANFAGFGKPVWRTRRHTQNVPSTSYQGMKFPDAPYGLKMACGENPKRVYGGRNQSPSYPNGQCRGLSKRLDSRPTQPS